MMHLRLINRFGDVVKCARLGVTKPKVIQSEKKPDLICLHELLDNSKTFTEFAANERIQETVNTCLLDARNHGKSEHCDSHTFKDMAYDLIDYIANRDMKQIYLLGHGMGGRTIMAALRDHKSFLEDRVRAVILVNSIPSSPGGAGSPAMKAQLRFIQELKSIDLTKFQTIEEVENHVRNQFQNEKVANSILRNIKKQKDSQPLSWRINLQEIEQNLDSIMGESIEFTWEGPRRVFLGGKSKFAPIDQACDDYSKSFNNFSQMKDLLVFRKSAHFLHLSESERFAKEVALFIQEVQNGNDHNEKEKKKYLDEALSFDV